MGRRSVAAVPMLPMMLALTLGFAACGKDNSDSGTAATGRVLAVPASFATIQSAVDKANPGDLVLISPGTYRESIEVHTKNIVIRGLDRNTVMLDGTNQLINGFVVEANGVAIENLTVHGYQQNGIIFNGAYEADGSVDASADYGTGTKVLQGYRVSYVTSYDNGLYGVYAFASRSGQIDHSLTSGHPDSGFYIGQCKPCEVTLSNIIAENNAIGYYGTNASGKVFLINSVIRGNRLGIAPNSQKAEKLAPQEETVIAGNLVIDNDNPQTPPIAQGFFGGGIAIGGGTKNTVLRNRVQGHDVYGIGIVSLVGFDASNNRVEGNVLSSNGVDLLYAPDTPTTDQRGNCFIGNTFTSSAPATIERAAPCTAATAFASPTAGAPSVVAPAGLDYRRVPPPAAQPGMANPASAPASPAVGPVPSVDLATITVPPVP